MYSRLPIFPLIILTQPRTMDASRLTSYDPNTIHSTELPRKSNIRLAAEDIRDGVASIHIWPMLGWQEIRQRYRRSTLGPFWLTISTGTLLTAMGPLYGKLFNQNVSGYFLYLSVGYILWQLIGQLINDGCNAFISSQSYITQVRLPLSVHVLRGVWRNMIIFFHNLLYIALVLLYIRPHLGWQVLLFPIALLLIAANGVWIGLTLGLICARFRDMPQIVGSLVTVAFFLTPVMWQRHMLGRHAWAVNLNPFYHFLEIARSPLIGTETSGTSWACAAGITVAGYVVTLVMFSRFRARIAYWL